jgi:hypothetical protein
MSGKLQPVSFPSRKLCYQLTPVNPFDQVASMISLLIKILRKYSRSFRAAKHPWVSLSLSLSLSDHRSLSKSVKIARVRPRAAVCLVLARSLIETKI